MSVININKAIYEDFGKVKRTPLIRALEPLDPDKNIAVKAPIREGKTFAICHKIATSNKKVLYVVRTHEQAKEVVKRLSALGVTCAHVAGVRWKKFTYKHDSSSISWTPADLWQLLSKNRRKNIVERVSQMLRDGLITAVITVPQIAIHFEPEDFDILVLDEEQTVNWFKPESQLLFTYDRDFGRYTKDIPLERATVLLKNKGSKGIKNWISYAEKVLEVLATLDDLKRQYKAKNKPNPEKKAMEKLELELNAHWLPYKYFNIDDKKLEEVVKVIEACKRKPKLNDELYEAYDLMANSAAFIMFRAFTTKDGGRIWGIVNTDQLLFKDWLNGFKAIWTITNKTSTTDEWLFSKLNRKYKLVSKESFRFASRFINAITNEPFKIAKILHDRGTPTAWVTGCKKDARKLKDC